MGRLFGTDGIRGLAGKELTAETAYRLGLAVATLLKEKGIEHRRVLIGKDTRLSGDLFESAIASGLMACGADAQVIGLTTTPAIAYLTRQLGADAGIMISASHNSAEYNGLKVFGGDGYKLSDEDEERAEEMILSHLPLETDDAWGIGRRLDASEENQRYARHVISVLQENAPSAAVSGKRILFDLAHGSACATAKEIFKPEHIYGFEAEFLSAEPNGARINDRCGSTHLDRLSAAVTSGGYDLGFAFDGDADRCLAVDETGRVIDGDVLIACLARDRIECCGGPETAVVTVLTNLAFHHYCKKYGIAVSVTDVGDRYVLREMLRIGADIGGEQSGHIILPRYATTGDGQVTAAVAIGLFARSAGKKASEVFGQMVPLPQASRNVKVPREDKERVLSHPALSEISETVRRRLGNEGRVLIRPSGTEALIRIMLEGKNQEEIDRMAEEIAETIQKICGVQ